MLLQKVPPPHTPLTAFAKQLASSLWAAFHDILFQKFDGLVVALTVRASAGRLVFDLFEVAGHLCRSSIAARQPCHVLPLYLLFSVYLDGCSAMGAP